MIQMNIMKLYKTKRYKYSAKILEWHKELRRAQAQKSYSIGNVNFKSENLQFDILYHYK